MSTVWQSLVGFCLLTSSANPGDEVESRTYGGWSIL